MKSSCRSVIADVRRSGRTHNVSAFCFSEASLLHLPDIQAFRVFRQEIQLAIKGQAQDIGGRRKQEVRALLHKGWVQGSAKASSQLG